MNPRHSISRVHFGAIIGGLTFLGVVFSASAQEPAEIRVVEVQQVVEVSPAGANTWVLTRTNQVLHTSDRIRTGPNSRATLLWSDRSVVPLGPLTELEILPPAADEEPGLHLIKGVVSFFHRDKPGRIHILTPGASAGIEGTEFVLEASDSQGTLLSVIDGKVGISNSLAALSVTNGEQAVVAPGQAPFLRRGFIANNLLQWCFYYPAVLDPNDLTLSPAEQTAFGPSLAAYQSGDVLAALSLYPTNAAPSDNLRIYRAALLLSVGEAGQASALLDQVSVQDVSSRPSRLANALRLLVGAIKRQPPPAYAAPELPTEFLAASYYEQSRAHGDQSLSGALALAEKATALSPRFGFAWERVAELQFSFGRTQVARAALAKSLELAPRNAQAVALDGFLSSAENHMGDALIAFDHAIALDPALGNAWLGRGLCRIKVGQKHAGREDLLIAAAVEPQRSLLRSYLGKAFADGGEETLAFKELMLARTLDPSDPTEWLYSALLKQQENQINPAISDLQTAQASNDNRQVFRSRMLLDQDRAVASANLASMYRDAGMTDVSVREAARAVTDDYLNESAHLFLSDSYYALLDPTQFNLRYDTAQFNEFLLANILGPVGSGRLSQQVSQQDYSKLFEADGPHFASYSDARTDGMFHQTASQYSTFGNTAYAVDLDYHHNDGVRVNNSLDNLLLDLNLKQQVSSQDTAMLLIQYENYHSGDNFQYYDQTNARPFYKFDEQQQPILVGMWRHEWAPGMQTLLLVDRLVDDQQVSDQAAPQLLFFQAPGGGPPIAAGSVPFDVNYQTSFTIYGAELQQIFQWEMVTLLVGGRYQDGQFETDNQFTNPTAFGFFFPGPVTTNSTDAFRRATAYSYLTVEPVDQLWLTGGVAADKETFPYYFRDPPIASGTDDRSQIGPKAALVWSPLPQATLRGVYSRSLGGVSLDESYRLEPTELAGFPQAFRSLISESIVGSQSAPTFETAGAALDLKFNSRTYIGLQVERLGSKVNQGLGAFLIPNGGITAVVSPTTEQLDYVERTASISLNQLMGDDFVFGVDYKINLAQLNQTLPEIPVTTLPSASQDLSARLQQVNTYLQYNHPSGFYARGEVNWYGQHNTGWTPAEPNVSFAQENIYVGYRLARRRVELQGGILNLSGGDYNLNPLTIYQELPRKRVFEASLKLIF